MLTLRESKIKIKSEFIRFDIMVILKSKYDTLTHECTSILPL